MLFRLMHPVLLFFLVTLLPVSYAHAGVVPALGINGTLQRSDVKRPSQNKPCGDGVDIATTLDNSTSVPADQNGNVNVTVTDFNAGPDGSRKVIAQVDPSGTGKNFVKMTVLDNGDPSPTSQGSQNLIAQLPSGIKCTGGSEKNKCLAQFVTTAGFGNCVVVSQSANASTSPEIRVASPAANEGDSKKKHHHKKGKKATNDTISSSADSSDTLSENPEVHVFDRAVDSKKKHHHKKKGKKAKKDSIPDEVYSSIPDARAASPDLGSDGDVEKGGSKKKHHHHKNGKRAKKDARSTNSDLDVSDRSVKKENSKTKHQKKGKKGKKDTISSRVKENGDSKDQKPDGGNGDKNDHKTSGKGNDKKSDKQDDKKSDNGNDKKSGKENDKKSGKGNDKSDKQDDKKSGKGNDKSGKENDKKSGKGNDKSDKQDDKKSDNGNDKKQGKENGKKQGKENGKNNKKNDKRQLGTRAPRALLANLDRKRDVPTVDNVGE